MTLDLLVVALPQKGRDGSHQRRFSPSAPGAREYVSGFHHLYWKSQKYRLWLDGLETSPSSLGSLLKRLYTGCALFCFPVNSFETNPKVINFPQYFAETFSVTPF